MKLDLTKLLSAGDGQEKYTVTFDMPVVKHYGEDFDIEETSPFDLSVRNESGKSLTVTGRTEVKVTIPCDRCLKDVTVDFPVEINEDFVIEDEQIVTDSDENADLAEGKSLDVDRLVYDQMEMNWPDKVLCRPDCKGLCPVCGHDLNDGGCGCNKQVLDPRMAQFLDVFNSTKK
ncbi:MAG: DUF177 domain-containing protein [Lachnospiraceae bacterium]|nr:DUF177 domain-containing protein [Lachnospiraceae bacterium]